MDTRLTHEHLISRNNQQPTCDNAAYGNQSLTIKHCLQGCPNWGIAERNNIQGDIRTLLGKNCEVDKIMRFKEMGVWGNIEMIGGRRDQQASSSVL